MRLCAHASQLACAIALLRSMHARLTAPRTVDARVPVGVRDGVDAPYAGQAVGVREHLLPSHNVPQVLRPQRQPENKKDLDMIECCHPSVECASFEMLCRPAASCLPLRIRT